MRVPAGPVPEGPPQVVAGAQGQEGQHGGVGEVQAVDGVQDPPDEW